MEEGRFAALWKREREGAIELTMSELALFLEGSRAMERAKLSKAAAEVLGGFAGTAVTDGYAAYEALANSRDGPGFTLAHCWSHVRRKYVEAAESYPNANEMLEKIGALYAIEARADEAQASLDVRGGMRREESRPIVDDIYRWITTEPALPKSLLGKAIGYTQRLWPGLVRFVDDA